MSSRHLPLRFWLLTVASLAGMLITLALGFWQLSRAAEKLALQAAMDGQQKLATLDSRALTSATVNTENLYRSVRLQGTWLGQNTVFLDNRQMDGKQGFFVLTPLRIENSATTVVVQRGWVQRNFEHRTQLPVVPTPSGPVEVVGRIAPPPSKLYEFEASRGGLIRQNLDLGIFSREIGVPLLAVSVLQLSAAADGLLRDWPAVNTGVETHYGYAFQWFALCGLIFFLYGWFQIVRRFIPPR